VCAWKPYMLIIPVNPATVLVNTTLSTSTPPPIAVIRYLREKGNIDTS